MTENITTPLDLDALEATAKAATQSFDPPSVLALIAELREAREVLAGADHTAAKYWKRMRDAESEMHQRELHHFESEQELATVRAERDAAHAVIEKARVFVKDAKWFGSGQEVGLEESVVDSVEVAQILASAPSGVLAERDARALEEFADRMAGGIYLETSGILHHEEFNRAHLDAATLARAAASRIREQHTTEGNGE